MLGGVVAAAGFGTEAEDIPVAGVLFGPTDGALAGLAEFFFVWGGGRAWVCDLALGNLLRGFTGGSARNKFRPFHQTKAPVLQSPHC